MGAIYELRFPSGKSYVGQTKKKVGERWHLHRVRKNKCWYVANAIRKYGWKNVEKIVIERVSDELLDERERYWIREMKTLKPGGYNLTEGGDENPMDNEDVRAHHLEKMRDEDHRLAQKLRSEKMHADEAWHADWAEKNYISSQNPEKKAKHAMSTKKSWDDPLIREARTEGIRRAFEDDEVRHRKKVATTAANKNPENKAKISATFAKKREERLALLSPEEREKKETLLKQQRERQMKYLQRKREREFE